MMKGTDMEDDDMEIQLLIKGARNETNLYEVLGGILEHNTHQMEYELDAPRGDGAKSVPNILTDHEVEDYLEPSMLGCISAPWRRRRRVTHMKSRSSWRGEVRKLFGSQYPFTSGGEKCRSRKNNDHWTEHEMIELVDGVFKYGIGKWSRVKEDYFSTSIRTATHLKDKWRNLVIACRAKSSSKKTRARRAKNISKNKFHQLQVISVQKITELIVERFRRRILTLQAKYIARKKK